MSQQLIRYRIAAVSDAAGKYNPDAPLDGNEDNFYVDDNLSDAVPGRCRADEILTMGPLGCLLVVADGMGGMNAGEVASAIAIETVKRSFAPGVVTEADAAGADSRRQYMEQVVRRADKFIKEDALSNPEHKGMGSTIIMAWIVGDHLTLTWCGDSRAYRYNPVNGLEPLSTDHSYVQQLVNQGVISYEDTFEHPQGNIITRSLGDPTKPAEAETREFTLCSGDVILLCSDGLSGVLRDRLTYDRTGVPFAGDNIEDIIAANLETMTGCRDALMSAAREADWYDNVTVLLCEIVSGAPAAVKKMPATMPPMPSATPKQAVTPKPVAPAPVQPAPAPVQTPASRRSDSRGNNLWLIVIGVLVTLTIIGAAAWYFLHERLDRDDDQEELIEEVLPTPARIRPHHQGGLSTPGNSGISAGNSEVIGDDLTDSDEPASDSQIAEIKKRLIDHVNQVSTKPLEDYAKVIKDEINDTDFEKVSPSSFTPKIMQLDDRSKMVAYIDRMIDRANREDRESLNSIRKLLVSPKHLAPDVMNKMQKTIREIAGS